MINEVTVLLCGPRRMPCIFGLFICPWAQVQWKRFSSLPAGVFDCPFDFCKPICERQRKLSNTLQGYRWAHYCKLSSIPVSGEDVSKIDGEKGQLLPKWSEFLSLAQAKAKVLVPFFLSLVYRISSYHWQHKHYFNQTVSLRVQPFHMCSVPIRERQKTPESCTASTD